MARIYGQKANYRAWDPVALVWRPRSAVLFAEAPANGDLTDAAVEFGKAFAPEADTMLVGGAFAVDDLAAAVKEAIAAGDGVLGVPAPGPVCDAVQAAYYLAEPAK